MGSDLRSIGILIADDHEQFVRVLQAVLELEEGFAMLGTAANGEEAVERAAELEPDVVLMDISMPVLDGFDATRRILEARPGTRVIMVTGSNASEDRQRAEEVGAVAYVPKERIADELGGAVRTAMAERERLP